MYSLKMYQNNTYTVNNLKKGIDLNSLTLFKIIPQPT